MRTYLGFGVVTKNRNDPDYFIIENSINGQTWRVPANSIPVLSSCRTPGHVVNVYAEDVVVQYPGEEFFRTEQRLLVEIAR